jgi:HEAT repeat protein
LTITADSGLRAGPGPASSPALNCKVRTVNRSVVVSLLPQLDRDPGKRSDLLRSTTPIDLYLIAIGSLNDLVVRHDQRRAAIKALASQADWSARTLRRTALRARLSRYVRRDRLTAKGWAQAAVGAERLTRLEMRNS